MKTGDLSSSKATNLESLKHTKRIEIHQSQIPNHDLFGPIKLNVCFLRSPAKKVPSFQIFIDVPETQNRRRFWLRRSRVIWNNCKCFTFRVYLNHLLCIRNAGCYMQFAKREGNLVELTFAKTSGTVTWDRKKLSNSWPLRPSNHRWNNSGTHFVAVPFSILKWRICLIYSSHLPTCISIENAFP